MPYKISQFTLFGKIYKKRFSSLLGDMHSRIKGLGDFMEIGSIVLLIIAVGTPVALVWASIVDCRNKRQYDIASEQWLEKQRKQPKSVVQFVSGKTEYRSKPLEPEIWYLGHNVHITSESKAITLLHRCYERGYFEDEQGRTYPVCNVECAEVIKE
jgi:hypothetical protein